MKIHFITLALLVILPACSSSQSTSSSSSSSAPITLTGTLHRGMMAIGGEATGWTIESHAGAATPRAEVDCSAVSDVAETLDGKPVRAHGRWTTRHYIERGPTQVFTVESLEPAN